MLTVTETLRTLETVFSSLLKRGCKKTPHKRTDKSGECQFIGLFLTFS